MSLPSIGRRLSITLVGDALLTFSAPMTGVSWAAPLQDEVTPRVQRLMQKRKLLRTATRRRQSAGIAAC